MRTDLSKSELKLFENIYRRYFQVVYNYAYYLCHEHALAEDLTSEAFTQATHYLDKSEVKFKSLLMRIVHNKFIDETRKHKKIVHIDYDIENEEENIEGTIIKNADTVRLLNALQALKPDIYKEILLLYYKFELNHTEIAQVLGKDESNIRKLKQRAITKLKQQLD